MKYHQFENAHVNSPFEFEGLTVSQVFRTDHVDYYKDEETAVL